MCPGPKFERPFNGTDLHREILVAEVNQQHFRMQIINNLISATSGTIIPCTCVPVHRTLSIHLGMNGLKLNRIELEITHPTDRQTSTVVAQVCVVVGLDGVHVDAVHIIIISCGGVRPEASQTLPPTNTFLIVLHWHWHSSHYKLQQSHLKFI